jgi:hypothetical protein
VGKDKEPMQPALGAGSIAEIISLPLLLLLSIWLLHEIIEEYSSRRRFARLMALRRSEASCLRPNTMATRPSGVNLITMSEPLSVTQMFEVDPGFGTG